ncbi:unnamed protein product [Mytilus coruscus]|uniref:Uncharacterized protein n=1 Tax=Mytilus coruscus TaxID=42192 RepID=A0A6J8DI18_MYTCO|nr:unnamed protein product [Mytilus coruscus]
MVVNANDVAERERCVPSLVSHRDALAPSYMAASIPRSGSSHQPEYPVRRTFSGVNEDVWNEFLQYFEKSSSILGILKNQDGLVEAKQTIEADNKSRHHCPLEPSRVVKLDVTDTEGQVSVTQRRPNKEVDVRVKRERWRKRKFLKEDSEVIVKETSNSDGHAVETSRKLELLQIVLPRKLK